MNTIYFQLGIKTKSGDFFTIFDCSSKEIIKDSYVRPYLDSTDFIFSGSKIKSDNIKQFIIVGLTVKVKDWVASKNKGLVSNLFAREDVFDNAPNLFDVISRRINQTLDNENKKNVNTSKNIFIVHGHDEKMLSNVRDFVVSMGYKPVILKDEPNKGKTIIEKIETYSSDVAYAIVLYSPCDRGFEKNKPNEIKDRARQNVVFEHGYLISKLSRERVCALVKKNVERPSDVGGIVYIPYSGNWREAIASELSILGLEIQQSEI